jgi:hypothetical protein
LVGVSPFVEGVVGIGCGDEDKVIIVGPAVPLTRVEPARVSVFEQANAKGEEVARET